MADNYHTLKKMFEIPNNPEGDYFMYLFNKYRTDNFRYRIFYTPTPKNRKKFKLHGGNFRDCAKKYADKGRMYIRFKKSKHEQHMDRLYHLYSLGYMRLKKLLIQIKSKTADFAVRTINDIDETVHDADKAINEMYEKR